MESTPKGILKKQPPKDSAKPSTSGLKNKRKKTESRCEHFSSGWSSCSPTCEDHQSQSKHSQRNCEDDPESISYPYYPLHPEVPFKQRYCRGMYTNMINNTNRVKW